VAVDRIPVADPALLSAARERIAAAGLTSEAVRAVLGDAQTLTPPEVAVATYRLTQAGHPGLAHLATLFLLERPLPRAEVHDAATLTAIDAALAAGLVTESAGTLAAAVRLVPHGVGEGPDVWIASDLQAESGRPEFVPGVQRPTLTLTRFTPRRQVNRAADIGTGCGLHALLLARHADTVVATDVSARALDYARINAGLNAVELDLRLGDLTAPLDDEKFDLVVANPPYVISPESELVFRDSGEPGDSFNRRVATTVGGALAPGGLAVVLLSWAQRSPDDPPAPLQWLAGSKLDALLLVTQVEDIATAAAGWNRSSGDDPEGIAERLRRWTTWYRDAGIDQLGYGALVLRQTDRPAMRQMLPISGPHGPAGEQVLRIVMAGETCDELSDEQFADTPISLMPGVELRRTIRSTDDGAEQEHLLVQGDGLGIRAELDAATWSLLESLAVRTGSSMASLLPTRSGSAAPAEERQAAGALVRQLVPTGLIMIT
jgi:SAM-dependent methyltransferase